MSKLTDSKTRINKKDSYAFYQPHDMPVKIEKAAPAASINMPQYHYHNSYEIYYLQQGERYYFVKNKTHYINGGCFVLIDKYDIHITTSSENAGYVRYLINFKDDFIEGISDILKELNLMACFKQEIPIIRLSAANKQYAEFMMSSLYSEYNGKKKGFEQSIRAGLLQLLIFLSRQNSSVKNISDEYMNSSHKTISEITRYINIHYHENITLDGLSNHFHISPHYISRIFKKFSGISLVEYLNNVRIKEAMKLLNTTQMNMQQICEAVGYKSYTHFARKFKEFTGISPKKYSKGNNED